MDQNRKFPLSFYRRPTLEVAKDILGCDLIREFNGEQLIGRIVEVEAYIGRDDPACHAANGKTKRNQVMFESGGVSYVYFVYGMYYCLNAVTEWKEFPAAVLIRALEPVSGIEQMQKFRRKQKLQDLTSGPGKLCMAMAIDLSLNKVRLNSDQLFIARRNEPINNIVQSQRIGIREGLDRLWRFHIEGNRFVSK